MTMSGRFWRWVWIILWNEENVYGGKENLQQLLLLPLPPQLLLQLLRRLLLVQTQSLLHFQVALYR
jgi:hypothetical protein